MCHRIVSSLPLFNNPYSPTCYIVPYLSYQPCLFVYLFADFTSIYLTSLPTCCFRLLSLSSLPTLFFPSYLCRRTVPSLPPSFFSMLFSFPFLFICVTVLLLRFRSSTVSVLLCAAISFFPFPFYFPFLSFLSLSLHNSF